MEDASKDQRFAHIAKDPRFRSVPRKEKKVVVDKRFQAMFHDKRFKLQYAMDKRGRKIPHSTTEDLKKFYDIQSSEDSGEEETTPSNKNAILKQRLKNEKNRSESNSRGNHGKISHKTETSNLLSSENEASDTGTSENIKRTLSIKGQKMAPDSDPEDLATSDNDSSDAEDGKKETDLARGEGNVETSSSSDDEESTEDEGSDNELDHKWGELDADAPQTDTVTRRLAVCNMNWDRIKADDLFVVFNSFKPVDATITSVKIYPSDYGLERMKIEEMKGPVELVEKSLDADEPTEKPEGSKFHMEKLRKYQLNRLKYYYAVVECDRPETANKIYEDLDGMEYESSATQIDLRFIPDDVTFDNEPSSVAYKMPDATKYEANLFTTTALQQAKVDLTWDETDPDRIKTMQKAFKEADDVDLKAYLASSSEGEEESPSESEEPQNEKTHPKTQIEKYKQLLASIEDEERRKNERDIDMQITWEPGLKERTEKLIKTKYAKEDQTPFEEFLEKKKDKKKQKKKERKEQFAQAGEASSNEERPFSDDDVPSDVDLSNPYFREELDERPAVSVKKHPKKRDKNLEENEKDPTEKAELELLLMDEDDGKKHFNLQDLIEDATQSKRRKKKFLRKKWQPEKEPKVDDFQVNTADPRFAALYSSPLFNIDPSDPHFKKTKGTEAIIGAKQRKRHLAEGTVQPEDSITKIDGELERKGNPALSMLVKSIKSKTERFKRAKT